MNKLKTSQQETVIHALVEGCSIRSTERMTGVHRDTIIRLVGRVGAGCQSLLDQTMRNLPCEKIQIDEIWGYVGKKQRHLTKKDDPTQVGDKWVFVAIDAESKLVPSYRVGQRTLPEAKAFVSDLSSRLSNRVQLSSDALSAYVTATEEAFGANVDYGQIVKSYEAEPIGPGRYSPPHVTSVERNRIMGDPDPKHISTSYIERANLSMRMECRRFTRLTNAFSKRLENMKAAVALHFAHYNFVRMHRTIKCTPAMQAGIVDELWSISDLLWWAERARK